MKPLILISTLALSGCGAQYAAMQQQQNDPQYRKCAYQAELATPTTNNVFEDVFRKRELIGMCMRNG